MKNLQYWFFDGDYVVTDVSGHEYGLHLPTMRANPETFHGVVLCLEDKRWANDFLVREFKQIVQGGTGDENYPTAT